MLTKILMGEFLHEAESTRKLLHAIPNGALDFKPSEGSWTVAQLASHIAEIYNWYPSTLDQPVFDMATYHYDKRDISKIENIIERFEENFAKAKASMENLKEEALFENWKMVYGEKELLPSSPRVQMMRGFLMNHLYHHRGEMIVYLRASGNKVPGLYGPIREDR